MRVRLVDLPIEASLTAIAVVLIGAALIPTSDATVPIAFAATGLVVMLVTLASFHIVPARLLGRRRGAVAVGLAQVTLAVMLVATGGVDSIYFSYFLLPLLASVFDQRWRSSGAIGLVAVAGFIASWILNPAAAGSLELTRDVALGRFVVLAGVIAFAMVLADALDRSSRQVRTEEERVRSLIATLHDPIFTVGPNGEIVDRNQAAVALFGPAAHVGDRRLLDLLPFLSSPPDVGGAASFGTITDLLGRNVEVEVMRSSLAGGGDPGGLAVYVVHDITRHAEMNRMREQLLYAVAHELRGPLTVLDNALDLLSIDIGSLSTADVEQLLGSARRNTSRLAALMEDLLNAGNIQSGRFVVRPTPTDLGGLIADAVSAMDELTRRRGQQVQVTQPDPSIEVLADRRYAVQVLTNLLANASKYGPEGSTITVAVARADGEARVAVRDRGRGIPAAERTGIFERFYRVASEGNEPGVGLGLAIAKGIVDAHGGRIGVDSGTGEGTTVWFTLSVAEQAAVTR